MGGGEDTLYGGGGVELVFATVGDGDDTYFGGGGTDLYDFVVVGTNTRVNLNTGIAFGEGIGFDQLVDIEWVQAGSGADTLIGSAGNDTLVGNGGADRLTGNGGVDRLDGGGQRDTLDGSAGDDRLFGGTDADRLLGGTGNDLLIGGAGSDTQIGGTGSDTFVYRNSDIAFFSATPSDLITDFVQLSDVIDLSAIDADAAVNGNQTFAFIGTSAFSASGQIRYVHVAGRTDVMISTDFGANIVGSFATSLTGTIALTAADFVL